MKSAKQNTIRQRIDRHRITLIEYKTAFHCYSLVLNKARHADDGYKKNGPRKAWGGGGEGIAQWLEHRTRD